MSKRPPIERVFFTAAIGPMAVVRQTGAITWAEQWADQQGILLWEDLDSAAAWQISQSGRPTVVLELGRDHIQTHLLEPVRDHQLRHWSQARMWIYPQAIALDQVRWHTYREEVAEPARVYRVSLPAVEATPQSLPRGVITLDT